MGFSGEMEHNVTSVEVAKIRYIALDDSGPITIGLQKVWPRGIGPLVDYDDVVAAEVELVNQFTANEPGTTCDHRYADQRFFTSPAKPRALARSSRGQLGARLMSSSASLIMSVGFTMG